MANVGRVSKGCAQKSLVCIVANEREKESENLKPGSCARAPNNRESHLVTLCSIATSIQVHSRRLVYACEQNHCYA